MSARIARTIALGVGAGALVLGAAGPAFAADPLPLPNKASLTAPAAVTVTTTLAGGCDQTLWGWTTRVVGQKSGVANVALVGCANDVATWTVTSATPTTKSKKANAVVKIIATPTATNTAAAGERSVFTLVVKVNHKTGKPAKS